MPRDAVQGPGVIAVESYGGTEGRFEVAEVSVRLFPQVMADFIAPVKAEGFPYPDFSKIKPYYDDRYKYLTRKLVTFTTPAQLDGIGTGVLVPSADSVRGLVSLSPEEGRDTNLLQFDLRLPSTEARLAQALLELELECLESSWPSC